MKRYCVKCRFDKPEAGFKCLLRGKFGRTKVYVCADCAARMEATKTEAQRDAFGAAARKNNGTKPHAPRIPSFRREEP